MGKLAEFINQFHSRTDTKGKLAGRFFGAVMPGFAAAEEDMQSLRTETHALREETSALRKQMQAQAALTEDTRRALHEANLQKDDLARRIGELEGHVQDMAAQLSLLQEAVSEEGALRQNLAALNANLQNNNAALSAARSDSELVKAKLLGIERRLREGIPSAAPDAAPSAPAAPSGSDYDTIDYFDFENHFRGSIEQIKENQRIYLPYFADKRHVLDFGCGRGEFLSLLKEEGIPAVGVDVYEPYADYCTMQGLEAHCGDGLAFLAQMEAVDGIFAGQVIEHLQTEQIVTLCRLAYEKLPAGGCIIMETPNPQSLSIYTNAFYIDPSHVKPVHPLTMEYLLKKAGFSRVERLCPETSRPPQSLPPLGGAPEAFNAALQALSDTLYGCQDYAVIAVK